MTRYFITDVMFGRGGESTYHPGNIAFRQLVEDHKVQYYTTPRSSKNRVVVAVVRKWRTQNNPPGRFLTRSTPFNTDGHPSLWHDVGDQRALKKASHSLRDSVRRLSIEQKQREEEEREEQSGDIGMTDTRSDAASCLLQPISGSDYVGKVCDSELPVSSRVNSCVDRSRKRGRGTNPAVSISRNSSFTRIFQQGDAATSQLLTTASMYDSTTIRNAQKKQAAIVFPPRKKQRVVCDEREDVLDDSRLCHQLQDKAGNGRDGAIRHGAISLGGIPFAISWDRIGLPGSSLEHRINVGREREEGNASPCGSADWFSSLGGEAEMPVQHPSQQALPLASLLIGEITLSNAHSVNSSLLWQR